MEEKTAPARRNTSRALILDIATRTGVSTATVSRVLNGRPDVSQSTRDKVIYCARELGYYSSRHASAPQTQHIGLLAPYIGTLYIASIMQGIIDNIDKREARLVVTSTRENLERTNDGIQTFIQNGSSGLLLIQPILDETSLALLRRYKFPFVVIEPIRHLPDDIPTVSTANISGARQATEHLISLGHRRIGIITGTEANKASIDRLAGYHSVLIANNIPYNPAHTRCGHFQVRGGYAAAQELLSLPDPPTAIFAFSDQMALGVLRAAHERGIRIPDDLSIVGFDNEDFTGFIHPPLTTIHQPLNELGYHGVEVLHRIMNDEILEAAHIELSTRLVIRDSTAPYNKD